MQTRVGHYAVANISRPWLSSATPNTPKKTTSKKSKVAEVINPIFRDWVGDTPDPFWKSIFTSASIGKFRRGFGYQNGILTYKNRHKIETFEVNSETSREACMDFLRARGITSEADQAPRHHVEPSRLEWADIKNKKKMTSLLIGTYISEMGSRYQLNPEERNQLSIIVKLGFIMGQFTDSNVVFQNGRITDLIGLSWDAGTRKFSISNSDTIRPRKTSNRKKYSPHKENEVNLMDGWMKFLDIIEKRFVMYTSKIVTPLKTPTLRIMTPRPSARSEPGTPIDPFVCAIS